MTEMQLIALRYLIFIVIGLVGDIVSAWMYSKQYYFLGYRYFTRSWWIKTLILIVMTLATLGFANDYDKHKLSLSLWVLFAFSTLLPVFWWLIYGPWATSGTEWDPASGVKMAIGLFGIVVVIYITLYPVSMAYPNFLPEWVQIWFQIN